MGVMLRICVARREHRGPVFEKVLVAEFGDRLAETGFRHPDEVFGKSVEAIVGRCDHGIDFDEAIRSEQLPHAAARGLRLAAHHDLGEQRHRIGSDGTQVLGVAVLANGLRGGADPQSGDAALRLAEAAERFGDGNLHGIVRPDPAVDQPHPGLERQGREEGRGRARRPGDDGHPLPPVNAQPRMMRRLEYVNARFGVVRGYDEPRATVAESAIAEVLVENELQRLGRVAAAQRLTHATHRLDGLLREDRPAVLAEEVDQLPRAIARTETKRNDAAGARPGDQVHGIDYAPPRVRFPFGEVRRGEESLQSAAVQAQDLEAPSSCSRVLHLSLPTAILADMSERIICRLRQVNLS